MFGGLILADGSLMLALPGPGMLTFFVGLAKSGSRNPRAEGE